jgi:hypothetical protein
MKKLLISLLVAVSAMFANDVSAQMINCGDFYTPWQYTCRNPGPRYSTQNVLNQNQNPNYNNGYNQGGGSVSIWNQEEYGNRPYPTGGYNNNSLVIVGYEEGTRPCTPQEERQRTVGISATTTFVGGLLGQVIGHNRNTTGQGAAYGLAAGLLGSMVTDCEVPVRRPIYASRQTTNTVGMQQSSYREQPQTREVASRCVVNGKPRKGLTEEECDELALSLSKTKERLEKVLMNTTETRTEAKTTEKSESSTTRKPCPDGKILVSMVEDIEDLKIKKGDEKCVSSQYKDDKRHVVVN